MMPHEYCEGSLPRYDPADNEPEDYYPDFDDLDSRELEEEDTP